MKKGASLTSRAQLFLALLTRCLIALFLAGLTGAAGILLVIAISGDPAMMDANEIPFSVAVMVAVGGLLFALMVYGMEKIISVNILPPPYLPEDDD